MLSDDNKRKNLNAVRVINSKRHFIFPAIITGFSGMVAQVVLLRELLVSFLGSELSIGILLANWLVCEALGALLLGRVIERKIYKIFFCSGIIKRDLVDFHVLPRWN